MLFGLLKTNYTSLAIWAQFVHGYKCFFSEDEKERDDSKEKEHKCILNKRSRSRKSYLNYQYALLSDKVVATYNHKKALHQEI